MKGQMEKIIIKKTSKINADFFPTFLRAILLLALSQVIFWNVLNMKGKQILRGILALLINHIRTLSMDTAGFSESFRSRVLSSNALYSSPH